MQVWRNLSSVGSNFATILPCSLTQRLAGVNEHLPFLNRVLTILCCPTITTPQFHKIAFKILGMGITAQQLLQTATTSKAKAKLFLKYKNYPFYDGNAPMIFLAN